MEQLNESDDSRLSLTKENIHSAAIKGWKIDLRMYRQFVPEGSPRLLRYVGANNEVDLIWWYNSDLNSDDVIIDNEDELSQTPAQRRQILIQMMQYNLFSNDVDPKTRNKIIEMMKLGNWEDIDDIEDLHAAKARRENSLVVEGKLPNFKDFDLHEIHVQEHNRFRLDVSYEEFEQANPQMAAIFDQHVAQHEQAVAQKAAMLAEQMNPQKDTKPAQSISYKDIPPAAQVQMLEKVGIEASAEDVVQKIQLDMAAKAKKEAQKQVS
jgi:hypothetical protein